MKLSLYPLLPVTITFIIGIVIESCGQGLWGLVFSAICAIALFLARKPLWAISSAAMTAGILITYVNAPVPASDIAGRNGLYSGVITEYREVDGGQSMVVKVDSCNGRPLRKFMAKVYVPGMSVAYDESERISFRCSFNEIAHRPDLPYEIDINRVIKLQGVNVEAIVPQDSILSASAEGGFYPRLRQSRHAIKRALAYSPVSDSTSSFLIAVLTGDRSLITPDTREIFRTSGLAHILALSGLHVGIIALLIAVLLSPLNLIGHRKLKYTVSIPILWAFALSSGLSPSVTRAVIVATVMIITMMMEREKAPLNSICIAILAMLFLNPLSIYSVGFQLSFAAAISISLILPALGKIKLAHPFANTLLSFLSVTIAATLGTGILVAYHFGRLPVWSLPANLLISFLLPPLLGGGVLMGALTMAGVNFQPLGKLLDYLYGALEGVAELFSSAGWSTVNTGALHGAWIAVYYAVIALLIISLYSKRRVWSYIFVATLTFTAAIFLITARPPGRAGSELYVTRGAGETTLFVREGNRMTGITSAKPHAAEDIRRGSEQRYSHYMARHGVDSITIRHLDNPASIRFKNRHLVFTNTEDIRTDELHDVDYLIVYRGFKGNIVGLANKLGADSVVLSMDIHHRLHDRYLEELLTAGIPARSLKESPIIVR